MNLLGTFQNNLLFEHLGEIPVSPTHPISYHASAATTFE